MLRATRFLLGYTRDNRVCEPVEVSVQWTSGPEPATLLLPRRRGPAPAWIVLHGITVFGRHHPSLLRFAHALAGTGAVVLIPEIEAWTRLEVRTEAVIDAAAAAAEFLEQLPEAAPGQVGLVGFSFGSTQGLVAASSDPVASRLRSVIGFGGYCELERLSEFMFTGEHQWNGSREWLDPDPYGRWIVAANFLGGVPGLESQTNVRQGLLRLAEEAGKAGLYKPDDYMDPLKAEIRASLSGDEREVWDLIAPPAHQLPPDLGAARELAQQLARAGLEAEPLLDPRPLLPRLRARPVLAHGLADRLIPYTETLRLLAAMPAHVRPSATVTPLFGHSIGASGLSARRYASEAWRFLRFLHQALRN
jgi:pimeloyl-ACP methyl ester carboxylesterase